MSHVLTIVTEKDFVAFLSGRASKETERSVLDLLRSDAFSRRFLSGLITRREPENGDVEMNKITNVKTSVTPLKTGIAAQGALVEALCGCLANTHVLLMKTQVYHWNVSGPLFFAIHNLTEAQYEDLFAAEDVLAERVRALGYPTPVSAKEMLSIADIEEDQKLPGAAQMLTNLVADHETVSRALREAVEHANDAGDYVSADMLTLRIGFHEKAIWMLRSLNLGA